MVAKSINSVLKTLIKVNIVDCRIPASLRVEDPIAVTTQQLVSARHRPLVIITSNNEKELPDAFLRRCFFHYIQFPDNDTMQKIVDVHYPDLKKNLLDAALKVFFQAALLLRFC